MIILGIILIFLGVFFTIKSIKMIINPKIFVESKGNTISDWKTSGIIGLMCGMVIISIGIYGICSYKEIDRYQKEYNYHITEHECYVCEEKGNINYGNLYFCVSHYAYVKTIVEYQ